MMDFPVFCGRGRLGGSPARVPSVSFVEGGLACAKKLPRGFALVELAIAIVIMSLLLGGGLLALNSQTENQRINNTRRNLDVVKVALENFIAREGRLPCPARADLPPSDAAYGVEAPRATGPANCTGTIATGTGFKGIVPWVTLGLNGSDVLDGWSHRITYHVAPLGVFVDDGTLRTLPSTPGMRGGLTLHNGTPVAPGLPATGNQINACSTTAADNTCNNAAVVVLISHGRNGLGAWQESGLQMPLPASGAREEVNTDNNASYLDVQVYESSDANHFDDLVLALAPRAVLTPLIASNQIKAEGALLAEGFESLKGGVLSWALDHKSGGEYDLPDNVSEVETALAPNVPKDPWGKTYRYERESGVETIDEDTDPGLAYKVISNGPDQSFGTVATDADNIVLNVSVAEIKSVLAKTGF